MTSNSKSPLPPFSKGGNGSSVGAPVSCRELGRSSDRALISPFGKGGPRGICFTLFLCLLFASFNTCAQPASDPTPLQFNNVAEQRRFHDLVAELRCVMCQNQSLADSNAQIAVDLRREVLTLMREGRSDAEVRDYLVERYGEFVLYRPQVGARTWLLWFGPAVLLVVGGVVVARIVSRRASRLQADDDPNQEW